MTALRNRSVIVLMAFLSAALLSVGGLVLAEHRPVPYEDGQEWVDVGFLIHDSGRCYLCSAP